ncbi:MAG: STAS domain-containing protein [SAR324 cluster bacterium]|nr:STAS domain-containing protein [SAR324 cluster bacterium]
MMNCTKIDSSGLEVIFITHQKALEQHINFVICQPNNYVANILEVTNINRLLTVYQTKQEALESIWRES